MYIHTGNMKDNSITTSQSIIKRFPFLVMKLGTYD